jgi:hypothetical protein
MIEKYIHTFETEEFICKFREITWKEGLFIDALSFKEDENRSYFSTEFEKREILDKAIIEIFDKSSKESINTNILSSISHLCIEKIWEEYQRFLHISTNEARYYYNCAKNYFDPNFTDKFPVPPEIIEVDFMMKGIVHLSKTEFDSLSIKDFEKIQLIISVYNEK